MEKQTIVKDKRESGVLVNVSSFPGDFGVGGFSKNAEHVVSVIAEMGFKWWQVLPITTLGVGDSPYSGVSTYAGNFLYIDPYSLLQQGLITHEELLAAKYKGQPYCADYDYARATIKNLLKTAFTRLNEKIKAEIAQFRKTNGHWIEDYALFMAIAEEHSVNWRAWDKNLKMRENSAIAKAKKDYADVIDFFVFEQYQFFLGWDSLKSYANKMGVKVLGDLPFYVADDSVDVWANPSLFKLDKDGAPSGLSGVPPDYFAVDGQIWGNPVYDFEKMREDGFSWWRNRIGHALKLYDGLRLDHFRAFAEYYVIPKGEKGEKPDARKGEWMKGPGKDLLKLIRDDNPDALIIAEDLGIIDEKVEKLVEWSGFPCMRVMQFAFDSFDSMHLPHKYTKNMAVYTGTHDNNTTLGWLYDTDENVRDYCFRYCAYDGYAWGAGGAACPSTRAMIRTLMASVANLVVVPIQDLAGYGGDTRMNTPGTPEGNWRFRVHYDMLNEIDRSYFLGLNGLYGRNMG